MEDNGLCRVLTRGCISEKDGCSTLYVKNVTKVLLIRLNSAEKVILRSVQIMKMLCQKSLLQL